MAQCPTCGSNVPDNADVCPDCGMDLQATPQSAPAMQPVPAVQPSHPVQDSFTTAERAPSSWNPDLLPAELSVSPERPVVLDPDLTASGLTPPMAPVTPSPGPAMTASLTLKRGGILTPDRFVLGNKAVVGRFHPESGPVDVDMGPLPEASYISRNHAELRCDDTGQWFIKDMGARNGTFVRAKGQGQFQRVTGDQSINDGDEVSLGNACFEFHVGS